MGTTGTTGPSKTAGETAGERMASSASHARMVTPRTPHLATEPGALMVPRASRSAGRAASTTPTPTRTAPPSSEPEVQIHELASVLAGVSPGSLANLLHRHTADCSYVK